MSPPSKAESTDIEGLDLFYTEKKCETSVQICTTRKGGVEVKA